MSENVHSDETVIVHTRNWLELVVIAHQYCPFAKREVERESVRYSVVRDAEINALLHTLIAECLILDNQAEIETTLMIFPAGLESFTQFLEVLSLAERLLIEQGYEGIYQLASFHPEYCFQGAEQDDAANYTNRSPYPTFHLIREASIEQAIASHPDPESIPQRNVAFARKQGLDTMQALLAACTQHKE